MAFDAYISVKDIPGESQDDAHPDWFKVYTYNHDVSMQLSQASATGGLTGGEALFGDLLVSKTLDKASVLLNLACLKGDKIPEVIMEVCVTTGDKEVILRYTMTDVLVRSISIAGGSGGEDRPLETVVFACSKWKWEYTPIGGETLDRTWDLAKNIQP